MKLLSISKMYKDPQRKGNGHISYGSPLKLMLRETTMMSRRSQDSPDQPVSRKIFLLAVEVFFLCVSGGWSGWFSTGWGGVRLHQTDGWAGVHWRGNQGLLQGEGEASSSLSTFPNELQLLYISFACQTRSLAPPFVGFFQIAYYKIPHYVLFVTSYPLTASGKVGPHTLLFAALLLWVHK